MLTIPEAKMNFKNLLLLCISVICITSLNTGQSKKIKFPPLVESNQIQRLVNHEKALNKRITFVENGLKHLKQKQADLRKEINDQIENEIKQVNEIKEKLSSENKQLKSVQEKKTKKYIERSEERIQNLKRLQEELKNTWKDS